MNDRTMLERILVTEGGRVFFLVALLCVAGAAGAAVTISTKPTKNITCNAANVCTPSKTSAVLNATDLMNLLANSNVVISTSPAASAIATNIVVSAPVTWSTASALTLDSYDSVTVNNSIAVTGSGGLDILTNDGGDGGTLSFGTKGSVTFANTADALLINNEPYVLVSSPAELAGLIADDPSGYFALAAPYDAAGETYTGAPVPTEFTGIFEGLGNRITHLTIHDTQAGDPAALFAQLGAGGEIRDLELMTVSVKGTSPVGGAVARNFGTLTGSIVDGSVTATVSGTLTDKKGEGGSAYAGGLVGWNNSTAANILAAWAGGPVELAVTTSNPGGAQSDLGGLVGMNVEGSILDYSFAVGSVTFTGTCVKCAAGDGVSDSAGGLVGTSENGIIDDASAAGSVIAGNFGTAGGLVGTNENVFACACGWIDGAVATGSASGSTAGGLLGYNYEIPVSDSTSSGVVSGGLYSYDSVGGFVGYDASPQPSAYFTNDSWNLSTSGIGNSTMGAGNVPSDPGITGID